jgi:hypothetical protein
MAGNKTGPTEASVAHYLDSLDDDQRRADSETLIELMSSLTGEPPAMWGPSIIGFGHYHYRYESGREGEMCRTGFAPRKGDISIYLMADGPRQPELLAKLGKHRMGKACLYVKRLADVDVKILKRLVADSIAELARRERALRKTR